MSAEPVCEPDEVPIADDEAARGRTEAATQEHQEEEEESEEGEDDLELPPLPTPVPASCSRPPCLKRTSTLSPNSERPFFSNYSSLDTALTSRTNSSSTATPTPPSVTSPITYSFSAPRYYMAAQPRRQVHFDSCPPESFDTFAPEDYDRSQIECTQGGSDLDLRMPSKCKRYNGDGEEESDAEDDGVTVLQHQQPAFGRGGSTGWTCLKGGSVIGSIGGSKGINTVGLQTSDGPRDNQMVSLPVHGAHGIRSFGGLARKSVSVGYPEQDEAEDSHGNSGREFDDDESLDLESDSAAAFEAAVIASMPTKSPNATPKASPSIIPRWSRCTGYFADASAESSPVRSPTEEIEAFDVNLGSASGVATSRQGASAPRGEDAAMSSPLMDRTPRIEATTITAAPEDAISPASSSMSTPSASVDQHSLNIVDPSSSPEARRPINHRREAFGDKAAASGSSDRRGDGSSMEESSPAALRCNGEDVEPLHVQSSPSPLSSRCSSTDPWSSLGSGSSGDECDGTSSPHGQWSSCTSPDMIPVGLYPPSSASQRLAGPSGQRAPSTTKHLAAASQAVHQTDSDVSIDEGATVLPGPQKTALGNALSALEAHQQLKASSNGFLNVSNVNGIGIASHSSSSSTDEDTPPASTGCASQLGAALSMSEVVPASGSSSPNATTMASGSVPRVKPRRKSSGGSSTGRKSSSRSSSLVLSFGKDGMMTPLSSAEGGSPMSASPSQGESPGSASPAEEMTSSPGGTSSGHRGRRSTSSRRREGGSSGSGTSSRNTSGSGSTACTSYLGAGRRGWPMSTTAGEADEIEDEGALGGF